MSSTARLSPATGPHIATPATDNRIPKSLKLRTDAARSDAAGPDPKQIDNGDEARYADKCGTYTKGIKQDSIGIVNLAAYKTFATALDSGDPADFDKIILGGPRTLNGPQGGLAYQLQCFDSSQFAVPPAPALASEAYATELVELYWASLLRDIPFSQYASNTIAAAAATELSSMPTYAGPKTGTGQVSPDLLFRGGYPGETTGPYLSQFILQNTALGALPIFQKYGSNMPGVDFMLDPNIFELVQNGMPTPGQVLTPVAPAYLHNGRGLTAFTHVDVLYQAYFMAYLVLNTINTNQTAAPLNPGNPYVGDKTQNGFATFGQPDIASVLVEAASAAIKAVWYQKWFVHLRHRPESGGAIVYLSKTPGAKQVQGKLSPTVLNSTAVKTSFAMNKSYLLSQAFPEGSPTHPAYPTGHGAVAGACITILKFFFDGKFVIPNPVVPSDDGSQLLPNTSTLTVNGELNKLAHNISFGHGIHAGIHWRSDTDTSIQLGEAVALSLLEDLANTYNEKFTVQLQKVDGTMATISNQSHT